MKYELWFGDTEIGLISDETADFPGSSGRLVINDAVISSPALRPVREYMDFCIRTEALVEQGEFSSEFLSEEQRHVNVIESEEWSLLSETGERILILVPVFGAAGMITWRVR